MAEINTTVPDKNYLANQDFVVCGYCSECMYSRILSGMGCVYCTNKKLIKSPSTIKPVTTQYLAKCKLLNYKRK